MKPFQIMRTRNPGGTPTPTPSGPVIRSTNVQYTGNVSSIVHTFAASAQAGDLYFICCGHGYGINAPTGWRALAQLTGSFYNGAILFRKLTSADILAGSVTVTFGGSYYGDLIGICLIGNTSIRAIAASRNAGSTMLTTDSSPLINDLLAFFASYRSVSAVLPVSTSLTSTLQSIANNEASSILRSGVAGSGGAQSASVTYGPSNGDYQALLALGSTGVDCDYLNTYGAGNRSSIITVAATNIAAGGGAPANVVDGSFADSYWWTNATGDGTGWLRFTLSAAKVIEQVCLWMDNQAYTHGNWLLEGSNNSGSSWSACGAQFLFSGGVNLTPNATAYLDYRLRHMSGTRTQSPYIRELEFRCSA